MFQSNYCRFGEGERNMHLVGNFLRKKCFGLIKCFNQIIAQSAKVKHFHAFCNYFASERRTSKRRTSPKRRTSQFAKYFGNAYTRLFLGDGRLFDFAENGNSQYLAQKGRTSPGHFFTKTDVDVRLF